MTPTPYEPVVNCDNCGKETAGRMGFGDSDERWCYECAEAQAREHDPSYDPKHWKFIRSIFDDKTPDEARRHAAELAKPIPHDFKVDDFVVASDGTSSEVLKVDSIGGNYLGFGDKQRTKTLGAGDGKFVGKIIHGRVDCYRHATLEEIGNRQ